MTWDVYWLRFSIKSLFQTSHEESEDDESETERNREHIWADSRSDAQNTDCDDSDNSVIWRKIVIKRANEAEEKNAKADESSS